MRQATAGTGAMILAACKHFSGGVWGCVCVCVCACVRAYGNVEEAQEKVQFREDRWPL